MATTDTHHHHDHAHAHAASAPDKVRDPVCGMMVSPESPHRAEHDGAAYAFCCEGCPAKFAADPARYLAPAESRPQTPVAEGAIYTCPMHPEIRKIGPGDCPLCGMALEPVAVTAEAGPNPELREMWRRFWIGLGLALPLVALDMSGLVPARAATWIELVLASPVVLGAGFPFFKRGWASVRHRALNMFSLIALGVGASYLYSLAATLAPGLFPAGLRGADGTVPVYFEPAAVIIVLVLLGQILELRARERTGGAIRALLDLAPKTARRLRPDGEDEDIPLDQVRPGNRLRVRPGEAVPVDGVVLEGRGILDESMITGEAMPVEREKGASVIGGTLNGASAFVMRARKVGSETVLARIVTLVAEAQRSRAPIQRLADRVSGWFVPAVIAAAAIAFAAWLVWGPSPAFGYALSAAVSVLIIACPCALGLATPMSIMVGIGKGAGAGILIRDAEALERLERVDALVIDKTGTLTEGRPRVTEIVTAAHSVTGFDQAGILMLAASLERSSEHPLAAAILRAASETGIALRPATDFKSETGKGVSGTVDGRRIAIGANLIDDAGEEAGVLAERTAELRQGGATVVGVSIDDQLSGIIAIADPVKATTRTALDQLRADGIRIVMATGDNPDTARAIGAALGITEIEAGVLPERKSAIVLRLKSEGRVVAMAGDGINDAPALAAADVGIAMGTGTEIAIHSAGVTLLKGDLAGIARARALSRATMRNIRQNLALAFVYNLLGVPIAAGILYPAFGLLLSPVVAAAAMSLSSVSVIGNALRLRLTKL